MLNKPFFIILFLLILGQVIFSFYYSSEIINQNNLINQNEVLLQSLKIEKQELEKNLASITSIYQLQNNINQTNYINLQESLNLQN